MDMYRGKTFNRETIYVCGDYMDGDIYPVFQPAGKRRKRCKPTSQIQEKLNQKNAEKKITRLIHNNFSEKDIALHLTYRKGQEPENEDAAGRDVYNFIRRLKRRYKKSGWELKYISRTEYGKKTGRAHHHMILSGGLGRDQIEKLWGKGYANSRRLQFEEDGVTGLAHYMAKDKHFYKRWNQSRNLAIPEPAQCDGMLPMDQITEITEAIESGNGYLWFEERFPGFTLVEAYWYRNNVNRGAYIHFAMRRKRQDKKMRTVAMGKAAPPGGCIPGGAWTTE